MPKTESTQSLTKALGIAPDLPGESAEHYQASLDALIRELEAFTVLQVYLAEKIHECLWWIHRCQMQMRAIIMVEIAENAVRFYSQGGISQGEIRNALLAHDTVDDVILESIKATGHTLESLRQKAMKAYHKSLNELDQQIGLQTKILAGMQRSYEVAFHRKMNVERMQLQNELLRRNLQGISVIAISETAHA